MPTLAMLDVHDDLTDFDSRPSIHFAQVAGDVEWNLRCELNLYTSLIFAREPAVVVTVSFGRAVRDNEEVGGGSLGYYFLRHLASVN